MHGQTEIAEMLLRNGYDVNRQAPGGSSYLQDAALKGSVKMATMLLRYGARIDASNDTGGTALHDAALGGSPAVIKLLIEHGARIDAVDRESGATPLMVAASMGRTEALETLLKRGADPHIKDRNGKTALDRAREAGFHEAQTVLEEALKTTTALRR
jgi:ankyrin repeat protein